MCSRTVFKVVSVNYCDLESQINKYYFLLFSNFFFIYLILPLSKFNRYIFYI